MRVLREWLRGLCGLTLLAAFAAPAAAERVAVLLPGIGGAVPIDLLMRNRAAFDGAGWRTVIATDADSARGAALAAKRSGGTVFAVAMSQGAVNLADALGRGAEVDGAVFISGVLRMARQRLGTPAALPKRVLVVHNPRDACPATAPEDARRFVAWAGARAKLRWVEVAGGPDPRPCGPTGAHGYFLREGAVIEAALAFMAGR